MTAQAYCKWMFTFQLILSGFVMTKCDQETINYIAKYLKLKYDVVNNFADPGKAFAGQLTLENTGTSDIETGPWAIYFCHVRLIDPENIRNDGSSLGMTGLTAFHVNGCLHKIEPNSTFTGMSPGGTLVVPFQAEYWQISKTDVMPNWYVAEDGGEPRVLVSTAGESLDFVGAFDQPQKWKRVDFDTYNPYDAGDRYNMRGYTDKGSAQSYILPTPVTVELQPEATLNIDTGDWTVVAEQTDITADAQYLAEKIGTVVTTTKPQSHYISVGMDSSISTVPGHYSLNISDEADTVTIRGVDAAGVFYGVQSLLSLRESDLGIPSGRVEDEPRFHYRGMHVDVSRNFHTKQSLLTLLEVMAMYKLNKLHLHVTDDEGWRLEIPGLPELTEIGARRCHDTSGDMCIMPQLGSSPNQAKGQYYTVDDYREILSYAQRRHIEVIPEFDMPGHAHAAINAMLARYRTLETVDMDNATKYLLSDQDDQSDYLSVQYFTDNAINPCLESTYTFVRHVVREVKAMHADIQPLTVFHFGGDEVPEGAWINSSACWDSDLYTPEEIKEAFIMNISEIAVAEGLDLAGWEDGYTKNATELYDVDTLPNTNVFSYVWSNVWEWGGAKRAYEFANKDYKVILSHATHLYYDHPQEPDPEERGFYWATRISPATKTFGYMPDSVYDNIDVDRMGNKLEKDEICKSESDCTSLASDKIMNVIGIQGQLWSETVRSADQLDYMIYPRLLALAERAWYKAAWEGVSDPADRETQRTQDWERFANTLGYKELSRLDELGVMYAVSPPGARVVSSNKVEIKVEYPGLPVQCSSDNGKTWSDYDPDRTMDPGTVQLITRSANRGRTSRSSEVHIFGPTSSGCRILPHYLLLFLLVITFTSSRHCPIY